MVTPEVEMYEASPEMAAFVNSVCERFRQESKGNLIVAMSLAISLCAQTFLQCGGNPDQGANIGEAVKTGVITTLQAYKDAARATHKIPGGLN